MSFHSAYYSKNFLQLLDIWPKGFLPFPSIDHDLRGLSQSKATIIIQNISNKYVIFRVIQEQNCSLNLRCRPMIDILEPNKAQKIEILNDSDHQCTLSDRIYIEAIEYVDLKKSDLDSDGKLKKSDNTLFTQDFLLKYFENKEPEFFCFKCYETNVFSLIPMEEQLFRVEKKLREIENLLKRFKFWFSIKNCTIPFLIIIIALISIIIMVWINNEQEKFDKTKINSNL